MTYILTPTVSSMIITGLTPSQAVMTDASKQLVSVDYLNQSVKTDSSPKFAEVKLSVGTKIIFDAT
jgi:hypothetical protein